MRNVVKMVRTAIKDNSKEEALTNLNNAKSVINKIARKGIIHKNTAARKISRLSKSVNTIS